MQYEILALLVTAVIRGVNSVIISSDVRDLDVDAIADDLCQVAKVGDITVLVNISDILREFPMGIPDEATLKIIALLHGAKS